MKKFTKICLILAGILAGVGLAFCIIGAASGATIYSLSQVGGWIGIHGTGVDIEDIEEDISTGDITTGNIKTGNITTGDTDDSAYREQTYTYDENDIQELKKLNINVSAGVVEVLPADGKELKVEAYTKRSSVSCGIKDDTLVIRDKQKWKFFGTTGKTTVYVYLPSGMEFKEAKLNVDAGRLDIRKTELKAEKIKLDVGAGKAQIGELTAADQLDADVGAGEITISDCEAGELKLDCGVGKITLNGRIYADVDADCGIGAIDMTLDGSRQDFDYKLDCGAGEINLDGDSYSTLGNQQKINNHAEKEMDLDCGIGSIKVQFKETQTENTAEQE